MGVGSDSSILSSVFQYGAKVFMDAHEPVTLEEGDRYPLAPPMISRFTPRWLMEMGTPNGFRNRAFASSSLAWGTIHGELVEWLIQGIANPSSSDGRIGSNPILSAR